jgi:hypothetical protein
MMLPAKTSLLSGLCEQKDPTATAAKLWFGLCGAFGRSHRPYCGGEIQQVSFENTDEV